MAYPYVPTTHSDGQSWTAAKANLLENAVRDAQQGAAVRVFHNANQSITNNTLTALAFNSERFDTFAGSADTMHDTVTNNSRLTCRYAGKYMVGAHFDWAASTTGRRQVTVRLNGATPIAIQESGMVPTGGDCALAVATLYDLAVNDYVELVVLQTSGGALNVVQVANRGPEFWMVRVA